jgi:hypothetical protein
MAMMFAVASLVLLTVVSSAASPPFTSAREIRRLNDASNEEFQYDLSDFSLRFEKCQFVKMYDDEIAQDEDSDSPLALKHFVVYRLCPTDSCSSCDKADYGTYTMLVEDYLAYTIENQRQDFENMCASCTESCNDSGEYCSGCGKICYQYENLEASGYIDAADYTQCQQLAVANNDDAAAANDGEVAADDDSAQQLLYIGPRCNSGNSITIGVFSDANCWDPVDNANVTALLGAKLSYHLLRHTYSSSDPVCLSCKEEADNDEGDADSVNEMCENLYGAAAKCESETGLEGGFIQMNRDEGNQENQVDNEFMACTFIKSLIWDSYSETGEINFKAKQDVIIRKVTKKQKVSLSLLFATFGILLGLMYYFQKKINDATSQAVFVSKREGALL